MRWERPPLISGQPLGRWPFEKDLQEQIRPEMVTLPAYTTEFGAAYCGDSLVLLAELRDASVNLVVTSPPFSLQRQKAYGNKNQTESIEWLAQAAGEI